MQNNLFSLHSKDVQQKHAPLAERIRPQTLQEFVGQQHIIGKGRALQRMINGGNEMNFILSFYGVARIRQNHAGEIGIANTTQSTLCRSAQ